ncbi:hypothetical protein PDIDSM_9041 [Penicillium digitatum]|nr:hypothetical protein PDIDSM_9041 [Penicillium digitatum]
MSDCLVTYFEAQARLTTWTDELEFLGYILCELIDKDGLNAVGNRCHQAIDLPAIIGLLRIQSEKPDGCLARMMSEDELKVFSWFMSKSKDIRNMMAHHKIRNADELNHLENIKERLGDMLEFAIRGAASDCGRYEEKGSLVSLPSYLPNIHGIKETVDSHGSAE